MKQLTGTMILLVLITFPASAVELKVPSEYTTISTAIDAAADGDVILIDDGVYTGEENHSQAYYGKLITIQSEHGPDNCIIDCENIGCGFVFLYGETSDAILDGVTIRNAVSLGWGGAVGIRDSSPIIRNCKFESCSGEQDAGGVHIFGSCSPVIQNCVFTKCRSNDRTGAIFVSAAYVVVENCTISKSSSGDDFGSVGYFYYSGGSLINCTIIQNDCTGVYLNGYSDITIDGCTIESNKGSGIKSISCSPQIIDCTITLNKTLRFGGGIDLLGAGCYPVITGCDITFNTAQRGAGINVHDCQYSVIGGDAASANYFEGNVATMGADLYTQIHPAAPINATYNTFAGCCSSEWYVFPGSAFDLSNCTSQSTPIAADVYVSPSGSNDNDGLTADTPFKTITHALSAIVATETDPITIHLSEGIYSSSVTGEYFPLPLIRYTMLQGAGMDETVLDAENASQGLVAFTSSHSGCRNLTVENGTAADYDIWLLEGGGAFIQLSEHMIMENCRIRDCEASEKGGGIMVKGSELTMIGCRIETSYCEEAGGGFFCGASTLDMFNCLIEKNSCELEGAAGVVNNSTFTATNCTIAGHTTGASATLDFMGTNTAAISNSIIRNGMTAEIAGDSGPEVTYSNISGGFTGTGNMDQDPLFHSTETGDYFLSHEICGQSDDSPCIDAGSDDATEIIIEGYAMDYAMNQFTTRSDGIPDTGIVDMGYHYPAASSCTELGCTIEMPSSDFGEGDICYCNLVICNPTQETYTNVPVFAILDVFGTFFFAPDFSSFNHYIIDVPAGESVIEVFQVFSWPSGAGQASGIRFYGAMTDAEITTIFGTWDMFEFGWH